LIKNLPQLKGYTATSFLREFRTNKKAKLTLRKACNSGMHV